METGKQKSSTIDRRYHAILDPLARWKTTLSWICAALGVLVSIWIATSGGIAHMSAGPLSQSHQFLEHDGCDKCHTPFVPIRIDALSGVSPVHVKRNNESCSHCHAMSGHFVKETREDVTAKESCNACHHEHRGADHSLVRVSNQSCVRCHADLSRCSETKPADLPVASNFDSQHPKFALEMLESDPGTIRFSHRQHLRLGQPKTPGDGTEKRLENIDKAYLLQYKDRAGTDGLLQLKCSDCHERDVPVAGYESRESRDATFEMRLPRSTVGHRTFKPIEFGKHCAACHSLDGVPHGLNKQQTEEAIASLLPQQQLKFFKTRGLPEKWSEQEIQEIEERETRLKTLGANAIIGCLKCHESVGEHAERIAASVSDENRRPNKLDRPSVAKPAESIVAPSNLLLTWLPNASFNHGSHLRVACIECHPQPFKDSPEPIDSSAEANQVMIRGLNKCRECHKQNSSQQSDPLNPKSNLASADCIDCHRFHVDTPKTDQAATWSHGKNALNTHWVHWLSQRFHTDE